MTLRFLPFRPGLLGILVLVGFLPLLTSCSDESLVASEATSDTFARYVALGNSITAGFQSNGIVDSTQQASYANLLAGRMNTRFEIPRLNAPGCPPPVDNIILSALDAIGGDASSRCGLRSSPIPTALNNVAVPGAKVIDALNNGSEASSPNELTTFILGGRTQVEAATQVDPTFASVWLGNNDALRAALSGTPDRLTPIAAFESQITRVVDSLSNAGAERGVLIGVANPTYIPNLSPGQAYAQAESQINQIGNSVASQNPDLTWGGFSVEGSCSGSGATTRIPFQYGIGTLFTTALQGTAVQLDCGPSSAPAPLLTPAEQRTISSRVQAYNSALSALASDNGWAYVDVNPVLAALYGANAADADPNNDLVPKFPNPPNLQNPSESPPTFGPYFSEDGVHPSSPTHRVVAHLVIQQLNSRYEDVSLDQISIPDEIASLLETGQN